jgi:small-conductance mechanosensitive channel
MKNLLLPGLALGLLVMGPASAQDLPKLIKQVTGQASAPASEPAAEDQRQWADTQLSAAKEAEKEFDEAGILKQLTATGLPPSLATDLKSDLSATVRHYAAAVDALAAVTNNRAAVEALRQAPAPTPPTDEAGVDVLRLETETVRRELAAMETQVGLDETVLERQIALQEEAARALRRVNEEMDSATPESKPRAAILARLAKARSDAASASVFAASWRLYADQLEKERLQLRRQRLETAAANSGLDTVFSASRAQAGLAAAAKSRKLVQTRVDGARAISVQLANDLKNARENPSTPEAVLSAATEAAAAAEKITRGYEQWLTALQLEEGAWNAVAAVAEKPESMEALTAAREAASKILEELTPWKDLVRSNIQDAGRSLESLRASPVPAESAAKKFRAQLLELTETRFAQFQEVDAYLTGLLAFANRMSTDVGERLVRRNLAERATHVAGRFQETAARIWNTEVFTADQTVFGSDGVPVVRKRGVTLGRLLLAIGVAVLTLLLAKRFSKAFGGRLRRQFSIDKTRGQFLERAIFITLSGIIILTALHWLHIPLTAFAFLGGALAIGIGFGVQTLMNNFISGLILTAERRIKVGDVIEVDGHRGSVISLGTRCSTIQKVDGIEVLVPNSYLLEKNVANWTMSDPHHRFDFAVGVDYSCDTDEVLRVLTEAVKAQPGLCAFPAASVYFESFGDNSLIFRIYYWLDLRTANALQIGSDLRLRVNRSCKEAGLGIAFPQRDVHLSTDKPLTVQLRPAPKEPGLL